MSSSVVYFLIPLLKDNKIWILMVIVYILNVILAILFIENFEKIDVTAGKF